jgi:hypothetical protein
MESMQEQLQQTNLGDYPEHVQAKAEQLKERFENKIQQRIEVLEKQGFSSSTIREVINILPVPAPKIPKARLPKTPPPGTDTTTTTVSDTTTTTVADTTTTTIADTTTTTVADTTTTTN